jgi:ADP-ribose pyrophosphatase YjhB (NUDIX family)
MYRIFHGKHVLLLARKSEVLDLPEPDFIFKKPGHEEIKEALKVSKSATKPLVVYLIGKPKATLRIIMTEFKLIQASGGIVFNQKNEILLIKRLGKWDLPKGKIKKSETLEECAIREIEEETGAGELKIVAPVTETYHTYFRNQKWLIKKSHWFHMTCAKGDHLIPQLDEDITEVSWFTLDQLQSNNLDSYPAILWLLENHARNLLNSD